MCTKQMVKRKVSPNWSLEKVKLGNRKAFGECKKQQARWAALSPITTRRV